MAVVDHIVGHTIHSRHGVVQNRFRYSVDYVLLDATATPDGPRLFGYNRPGLFRILNRDHGGPPGKGVGVEWVRKVLAARGFSAAAGRILLLAQPRVLGYVFNPVSFWLCYDATDALRVVIAEVTNTFGDRHSYLCYNDDHSAITADQTLMARKIMHVSPFQPIEGSYQFRFDITPEHVGVFIDFRRPEGGVFANLTGPRKPLGNGAILRACLRRPFAARRVMALIHWQALILWRKGARYRDRPVPTHDETSP